MHHCLRGMAPLIVNSRFLELPRKRSRGN